MTNSIPTQVNRCGHSRKVTAAITAANNGLVAVNGPLYRELGGIDERACRRYTVEEAGAAIAASGHHGPWGVPREVELEALRLA